MYFNIFHMWRIWERLLNTSKYKIQEQDCYIYCARIAQSFFVL